MNAKDKERVRISKEIHDDIGSGLTNIRLLSEIAKDRNKNISLPEIDKISASANELVENMNEIIWSINSRNDTLSNLIAYLRRFTLSYFENAEQITVSAKIPSTIPEVQISSDFRRSTFLVIKESLHNIIKHADATHVDIDIEIKMNTLCISIKDNGKGFNQSEANQFSNGLKNMRERVEVLQGQFIIKNFKGTLITICLPI
jgi:signal transduction histidine kinase